MKCLQCKEEFEGRADAKFCSSKCRKQASRVTDNGTKEEIVTDMDVTDKKVKTLKDFGYSLKDLGVKWAPEGGPIFLRNDITSQQIRDLVTVMFAMKGKKFQQSKSKTYEEVV